MMPGIAGNGIPDSFGQHKYIICLSTICKLTWNVWRATRNVGWISDALISYHGIHP